MIGAGLALSSKTVRARALEAAAPAADKAREMMGDAMERAQSLQGDVREAASSARRSGHNRWKGCYWEPRTFFSSKHQMI
jgi:hypothetical protein